MLLTQIRRGNPAGRSTEAALIVALGGELLRAPSGVVFALFPERPHGVLVSGGVEVAAAPTGFTPIGVEEVNELVVV